MAKGTVSSSPLLQRVGEPSHFVGEGAARGPERGKGLGMGGWPGVFSLPPLRDDRGRAVIRSPLPLPLSRGRVVIGWAIPALFEMEETGRFMAIRRGLSGSCSPE